MAISEDLRGVQTMLGSMIAAGWMTEGTPDAGARLEVARLLCDNLSSLADQVEALEAVPLATSQMPGDLCIPALSASLLPVGQVVPLQ